MNVLSSRKEQGKRGEKNVNGNSKTGACQEYEPAVLSAVALSFAQLLTVVTQSLFSDSSDLRIKFFVLRFHSRTLAGKSCIQSHPLKGTSAPLKDH